MKVYAVRDIAGYKKGDEVQVFHAKEIDGETWFITEPKLRKIINKQVGSSRIWDYFHTRVLELFEKATFFGDYRDI